jgi:hypothetical protein
VLTRPLLRHHVDVRDLAAVQRRRQLPTKLTQMVQLRMQRSMISPLLEARASTGLPRGMRLLAYVPFLGHLVGRVMSRFVAIGFRPEHVRTAPQPGVPETA